MASGTHTQFTIRPMSDASARAIAGWRYSPPYDFYDAISDDPDLADLLNADFRRGRYFEVTDETGDLIGFFEFKHEVTPLEIGLGLRPDLTGRGLGLSFVQAGMTFAKQEFGATALSLSVATFNLRAITVYERAGFRPVETYLHHTSGVDQEFLRMRTDSTPRVACVTQITPVAGTLTAIRRSVHRMALRDLTAFRPDRLPFAPLTRRDQAELMDLPVQDETELAKNLRDIRRVNRLLGGTGIILRHLPTLIASIPPSQAISVLDLGTGSGDIPLAISRWAKRRGMAMTIVASDFSEPILREARKQLAAHPKITLAKYDARAVPLPDKSVDIALCSLSLHHFAPHEAVQVLREMDRIARHGFILNDLRRGRIGYAAAWLAAHVTTRNRLTRNDAPLSIRRAFTPDELSDLLHRAGVLGARISTHPWFRMAAVKTTPNGHA